MTRYGQLTFLRALPDRFRGGKVSLWLCDCGAEKVIPNAQIKYGGTKSCGCLRTKHGAASRGTKSAEYKAWMAMRARCNASRGRDFEAYAARGIGFCERWESFDNFLFDMGARPSARHSLGRIDNNKGYGPENCRWETPAQQARNKRRSKTWHIRGLTFESTREAGKHFGVDATTISYWVKTGKDGCRANPRY
jgi:hypothetical protein